MQDTHDRLAGLLEPVLQMCRTIEGGFTQIHPSEHMHVPSEPRDVILVVGVSSSCIWIDAKAPALKFPASCFEARHLLSKCRRSFAVAGGCSSMQDPVGSSGRR